MKKFISALLAGSIFIFTAISASASEKYDYIAIGPSDDGTVISENDVLSPYENYNFPLYIVQNGEKLPVSNSMGDKLSLKMQITKGKHALQEYGIRRGKESYYLHIKVLPISFVKQDYVQFRLTAKDDTISLANDFSFKTGFRTVSDDYINNLTKSEAVRLNNDRPLFTAEQLAHIHRLNDGENVTFRSDRFTYEVNLKNAASSNMIYNSIPISELEKSNPDAELNFLRFPAGPQFSYGKITLDVSNLEDYDGEFHVYSYYKKKLSSIPAKYDSNYGTITFNSPGLGNFVISDRKLTNSTIPDNPNTGASPVSNIMTLGLISALSGIFLLKNRK